jgi:hypothetical protein
MESRKIEVERLTVISARRFEAVVQAIEASILAGRTWWNSSGTVETRQATPSSKAW